MKEDKKVYENNFTVYNNDFTHKQRSGSKILWGLFFIVAAAYLLVSRFMELPKISVFNILLTLFFVWMFIEGLRKMNFSEILFSIAFLCIIHAKLLGITAITPWPVLGAALLGSIGLSMIFHKKSRSYVWNSSTGSKNITEASNEQCSGENIRCESNFGSVIRYINSDNFCSAELENNFGSMTIYLDNAIIQNSSAYINIENNFGEIKLFIPKEWNIQNNLQHTFGTVNPNGNYSGTSTVTLYLNGETNFGAITIYYV